METEPNRKRMDPMKTDLLEKSQKRANGFSLIEVMIAVVILVVGLTALMALFAKSLSAVQSSQDGQIARQKSRETMESIYAARNDEAISFDQIQNVSSGGIFTDGFQTMHLPGNNGIPGTSSDTAILDRVILPGKNGIVETAPNAASPTGDDVFYPLVNFQRQILISPVVNGGAVNLYMRKITVTVRVNAGGANAVDYVTTGYISTSQQQ
jgi:prepilin-type N-terminal cleavage/methylation domain-containing protein